MSAVKFMHIYWSKEVLLGYGGSTLYFIAENFDAVAGMLLTAIMVLTSILLQYIRIRKEINRDRREEERHQQELKQDQDLHNQQLNNRSYEN